MALHPEVKIHHKIDRICDNIKDLEQKLKEKKAELVNLEKQLNALKKLK